MHLLLKIKVFPENIGIRLDKKKHFSFLYRKKRPRKYKIRSVYACCVALQCVALLRCVASSSLCLIIALSPCQTLSFPIFLTGNLAQQLEGQKKRRMLIFREMRLYEFGPHVPHVRRECSRPPALVIGHHRYTNPFGGRMCPLMMMARTMYEHLRRRSWSCGAQVAATKASASCI